MTFCIPVAGKVLLTASIATVLCFGATVLAAPPIPPHDTEWAGGDINAPPAEWNWSDFNNWVGGVPGPADDVLFPTLGPTYAYPVVLQNAVQVDKLFVFNRNFHFDLRGFELAANDISLYGVGLHFHDGILAADNILLDLNQGTTIFQTDLLADVEEKLTVGKDYESTLISYGDGTATDIVLGENSGVRGRLELDGINQTTIWSANTLAVGENGSGLLLVKRGAEFTVDELTFGSLTSIQGGNAIIEQNGRLQVSNTVGLGQYAPARISIESSAFIAPGVQIGGVANGKLELEGFGSYMDIGSAPLVVGAGTGGGSFDVSFDASYTHPSSIRVGQGGTGNLNIADATLGATDLFVGNSGQQGTVELNTFNETYLNLSGQLVVGSSGPGVLNTFAVGFGGGGTCDPFDPYCNPDPPMPPGLGGVPNIITTTGLSAGDGGTAELNLVGTQIDAGFAQFGVNTTATLNMTQSVLNTTGGVAIALTAHADATLNASEIHADWFDMGRTATGQFLADNSLFEINGIASFGGTQSGSHALREGTIFNAGHFYHAWETAGPTTLLIDSSEMTIAGGGEFGQRAWAIFSNGTIARFNYVTNRGEITIDGTSEIQATIDFYNEGTVYMPDVAASIVTPSFVNTDTGLLTGNGWITQVDNSGYVRPGGDLAAGFIAVDDEYVQQAIGVTFIELGGQTPDSEHDRIWVDQGDARLGGIFDIRLINGYAPQLGHTFDIVVADNVLVPAAGPEVLFDFSHLPAWLQLEPVVVNLPGNRQALRLRAASVPEPGVLALFALGGLITMLKRRRETA